MEPTDLTIEILKEIRDEARSTKDEVRSVKDEVRGLNEHVRGLRAEVRGLKDDVRSVERGQTETEMRLATELIAVAAAVHEVRDELRLHRDMRLVLAEHERRITAVEQRLP